MARTLRYSPAMPRSRSTAFAILLVPLLISNGIALAQPAPPAGESPPDKKSEAEARFYKGKKLSAEGAWSAALAEFQASRKLYPSESATRGAAAGESASREPFARYASSQARAGKASLGARGGMA
jgi:hypothetical protein